MSREKFLDLYQNYYSQDEKVENNKRARNFGYKSMLDIADFLQNLKDKGILNKFAIYSNDYLDVVKPKNNLGNTNLELTFSSIRHYGNRYKFLGYKSQKEFDKIGQSCNFEMIENFTSFTNSITIKLLS